MRGHIFVIRGDIKHLACDAWLLPTDVNFTIEPIWDREDGRQPVSEATRKPWASDERVRRVKGTASDGPAIWLGNIGAAGKPASWYTDGVADFVRAAAAELGERTASGRPPLLAIHHVGTGAGGARESKGDVLKQLFKRLTELVAVHEVDVVVVSWDAPAHAAAQRARLHTLGGTGPDSLENAIARWPFTKKKRADALRKKARELAGQSRSKRLAVFMGAGVSAGAGLPGWTRLLAQLGGELEPATTATELEKLSDPRDQAALLERRFDQAGKNLRDALQPHLTSGRYSLQHGLLSSLPVNEFTTTNFDELFEKAARAARQKLRIIGVARTAAEEESDRWLLKLHGTVSQPSSIVLTRSSYIEAPRNRGALFGLVQAMLMTRHMLFVGYGLGDEDFHELIHEVRIARTPTLEGQDPASGPPGRQVLGTAITLFDRPIHTEIWSGDVDVVAMFPNHESGRPGSTAKAGREVELFLDLLGLLAADRTAFLLDEDYAGILTDDEKALAKMLKGLKVPAGSHDQDGWRELYALLKGFGYPAGRADSVP